MCGIAGIINGQMPDGQLRAALERMEESLLHRGPDEGRTVVFPEERAGLASRRLSIVDLECGSQPVANEDETVYVAFNGEIYNHAALREQLVKKGHRFRSRCDTEVIVHLYEELGAECLDRLHGMFGLAVYDRRARKLLLARDGPGMKPLYFTQTKKGFLFASEVKALLASGLVRAEPDPESINSYLALGYMAAPLCGFRGVEKLRAGHYLIVEPGKLHRGRFWRLKYDNSQPPRSDADYGEELGELLEGAVKSHLAADVPVGAFVSGGWDSSLVAAIAAEHSSSRLKTFSIVFPEDPEMDESRYSRRLAEHLGTDHHEIEFRSSQIPDLLPKVIRHLEEPLMAAPTQLMYQLSSLAAGHVKTVLSGEGADELFGGYPWLRGHLYYALRRLTPRWPFRLLTGLPRNPRWRRAAGVLAASDDVAADAEWFRTFTPREKDQLLQPNLRAGGPDTLPVRLEPEVLATCADHLQRRLGLEFNGRLADGILFQGDKMSMAHSLETRMPFLDKSVVDFALRLPSNMKVRWERGRGREPRHGPGLGVLRELTGRPNRGREKYVMSMLAKRLPAEIAQRRKQGLGHPPRRFAEQPVAGFIRELLLDGASAGGPLNRSYVEAHLAGWLNPRYREFGRPVMLMFLQSWWNEFFTHA